MDDYQSTEQVKCISMDIHPISVMNGISARAIQVLLDRMGIEYEKGLPKEAYLIAWYEEFCENRKWILYMLSSEHLNLLGELWDSKEVEMDEYRWSLLHFLKSFGLITYKKGNTKFGDSSEIYIIESMKKTFYFYLKSRDIKNRLKTYEKWENSFFGLTYYYGLIPLTELYESFSKILEKRIDYEEFILFIKCRADICGLGTFLKDRKGTEYFMNHNVEEPEYLLLYLDSHKDLDYKKLSYEQLSYIRYSYGIDNCWPGVSELGNLLVNELDLSYYRSTVLIHTILVAIQNSREFEKVKEQFNMLSFSGDDQRQKAEEYLYTIYMQIPVFEYKGYSRDEFYQMNKEKEWKNRRNRFKMIPGGKS